MEPKQKPQIIAVGGSKYRLSKLDARSASYIAYTSAGIVAPLMRKGKNNGNISVESISKVLPAVPRHEFEEIQTMLLKTVVKMNDVGGQLLPEPILKEDGSFAIEDLAYDAGAVIALTVSSFLFNVGGFFGGAGLIPAELEQKS